jgi:hypothetical protein
LRQHLAHVGEGGAFDKSDAVKEHVARVQQLEQLDRREPRLQLVFTGLERVVPLRETRPRGPHLRLVEQVLIVEAARDGAQRCALRHFEDQRLGQAGDGRLQPAMTPPGHGTAADHAEHDQD